MTFGLYDTGFQLKRLADILPELTALWLSTFGADTDTTPASPDGQIIGILAEREAAIWELLEVVFSAGSPSGAVAAAQDALFLLANKRRLPARATTVVAQMTGTIGETVAAGTLATTATGAQASLNTDATFDGSGNATGAFTCTVTGPVLILAGTLNKFVTPVSGRAITNALDGAAGADLESTQDFNLRRLQAISTVTGTAAPSLQSAVGNLPGVLATRLIRNVSDHTDVDGRPGHSFELVVDGGDSDAILTAIYNGSAPDMASFGNQTGAVIDLNGDEQIVNFSRPTDVQIYLDVELETDRTFPADGQNRVRSLLLEYGATSAKMGSTLAPFKFERAVATVPGILSIELHIGRMPNPVTVGVFPLGQLEKPVFDSTRVRFI